MTALALAADRRFDALLGRGRGRAGATPVAELLSGEGLVRTAALIAGRPAREQPATVTHARQELVYCWQTLGEQLLKSVALRPHWAQHFAAADGAVHFLPDGDRCADAQDLWPDAGNAVAACELTDVSWMTVNRGTWASSTWAAQPPALRRCGACASSAAVRDHFEAKVSDAQGDLPVPLERSLYQRWQQPAAAVLARCAYDDVRLELLRASARMLDALLLDWAAEQYATQPRAHTLRALASNGAGRGFGEQAREQAVATAETIAARQLSSRQWRRLLARQRTTEGDARQWAETLDEIAGGAAAGALR